MSDRQASQRERMVESQLIPRGIQDPRVLAAFRKVPRHRFVPRQLHRQAYSDGALPIGEGQTISQPYMVAVMVELAGLDEQSIVLEIGTGSGYQTAILCEVAARVYSIERVAVLAENARETLRMLGVNRFEIKIGDGTLGWPEKAPFDAIIVSAGSPEIPQPLVEQLGDGGRLVIPLQERKIQLLYVVTKTERGLSKQAYDPCTFVPLIGEYGWKAQPM